MAKTLHIRLYIENNSKILQLRIFLQLKFKYFQTKVRIAMIRFYVASILLIFHKTQSSQTDSQHVLNYGLSTVNSFDRCIIRIINFVGLDINFEVLSQPIMLIRYHAFLTGKSLLPFEMLSQKPERIILWALLQKKINALKLKLLKDEDFTVKDIRTLTDHQTFTKRYIRLTQTDQIRMGSKNKKCETDIYLQPPNEKSAPFLYYEDTSLGNVIKDPFWINHLSNNEHEVWKHNFVNTIPKYSLLLCNAQLESSCNTENDKAKWISAVLQNPSMVRISETSLIWRISKHSGQLYVLCPYCNPCNPFTMVLISIHNFPNSRWHLDKAIQSTIIANRMPHFIAIRSSYYFHWNDNLKNPHRGTKKAILENIRDWPIAIHVDRMSYLVDYHILTSLLPKNATIKLSQTLDVDSYEWKNFETHLCKGQNTIAIHPKLRPAFNAMTTSTFISVQEMGLLLQRKQFRFLSCHKEQLHWFYQLKGLIQVFDITTWTLLLTALIWILKIVKLESWSTNVYLDLLASILDQSASLFGNLKLRKSSVIYFSLFCIPLSFLYLGNLYKGDNISDLTLGPPLVNFDTFDSLLEYNFKIIVRPILLSELVYSSLKQYTTDFFVQQEYYEENGHEAIPVVSELLYELWSRSYLEGWKRLKDLQKEVTNQTWRYLKYSEMMRGWNYSLLDRNLPDYHTDILEKHLIPCKKAALIAPKEIVNQHLSTLKLLNKAVYYGKDIITETLGGYKYFGYFPTALLQKSKYYFQSGISEWWQAYFDWSIKIKTHVQQSRAMEKNYEEVENRLKSKDFGQIFSLCILPFIGLTLSLGFFVVFESKFVSRVLALMRKIIMFETILRLLKCPCRISKNAASNKKLVIVLSLETSANQEVVYD